MSQNIQILQNLGLNEEEARVYLALLGLGASSASILAEQVGLKRTTVYPILSSLAEKGFVNIHFQESKRLYYAEKPAKVVGLIHKKIKQFEDIIPNLESLDKKQAQMLGLRFLDTREAVENFYLDILEEYRGKVYLSLGNPQVQRESAEDFFIQFHKERSLYNVKTKFLVTEKSDFLNAQKDIRLLPKKYKWNGYVDIFEDISIYFPHKSSSLAIVVNIPIVSHIIKNLFEILFDLGEEKK